MTSKHSATEGAKPMHDVYVDVGVARRTVLTAVYDEAGEHVRTEKTLKSVLQWLEDQGVEECRLWSDGRCWITRLQPGQEPPLGHR